LRTTALIFITLAALLAAAAAPALADRAILTPTGVTLAAGRFRAEGVVRPDETENRQYWTAVGLSRLELEGHRVEGASGDVNTINLEVSLIPQTTLTPAAGIGVLDIADESERSFYLAVTKTLPLTDRLPLPFRDVRLTMGLGTGAFEGLFASAEATLFNVRLQAEYDMSEEVNFAVGIPIADLATAKALWIRDDFYLGLEIKPRF